MIKKYKTVLDYLLALAQRFATQNRKSLLCQVLSSLAPRKTNLLPKAFWSEWVHTSWTFGNSSEMNILEHMTLLEAFRKDLYKMENLNFKCHYITTIIQALYKCVCTKSTPYTISACLATKRNYKHGKAPDIPLLGLFCD